MTHSTVQLPAEAAPMISNLENLMGDARELDLPTIPSRCPNGLSGDFPHAFYGEEAARAALECAGRILRAVLEHYRPQAFEVGPRPVFSLHCALCGECRQGAGWKSRRQSEALSSAGGP